MKKDNNDFFLDLYSVIKKRHKEKTKKSYTNALINEGKHKIAQKVINREYQRRICKNPECNHMSHDHIRNSDTCFILDCSCTEFVK